MVTEMEGERDPAPGRPAPPGRRPASAPGGAPWGSSGGGRPDLKSTISQASASFRYTASIRPLTRKLSLSRREKLSPATGSSMPRTGIGGKTSKGPDPMGSRPGGRLPAGRALVLGSSRKLCPDDGVDPAVDAGSPPGDVGVTPGQGIHRRPEVFLGTLGVGHQAGGRDGDDLGRRLRGVFGQVEQELRELLQGGPVLFLPLPRERRPRPGSRAPRSPAGSPPTTLPRRRRGRGTETAWVGVAKLSGRGRIG